MMFYDVVCLKSILGFLMSERTSGVSPVIFSLNVLCPVQPLLSYIMKTGKENTLEDGIHQQRMLTHEKKTNFFELDLASDLAGWIQYET